jgi:hypothetical protein
VVVQQQDRDVACIFSWGPGSDYEKLALPKLPLLLAVLMPSQLDVYRKKMLADDWRVVGWYPTCHAPLADGFPVTLLCKEQKVPLIPMPLNNQKDYYGRPIERSTFNQYVPLGCSCNPSSRLVKLTRFEDMHRTMGVHRRTTPTKRVTFNGWHRFADTPLASYWFWGLLPHEKDRFKYEEKER